MIYEVMDEIKGKRFYPQDPDDGMNSLLYSVVILRYVGLTWMEKELPLKLCVSGGLMIGFPCKIKY